jgi:hypothetical protein
MTRSHRLSLSAIALLSCVGLLPAAASGQSVAFRRGDANGDGLVDLSDAVFTLRYLFMGGGSGSCLKALDSNDDGAVNITDPLFSLGYLFLGGPEPPAPGLRCGADPTGDDLGCESYAHCPTDQPHPSGASDFTSPLGASPAPGRAEEDALAGGPAPPAEPGGEGQTPERLIEESDIYKLEGDTLFVLNRYRGLQVIDLGDLDRPALLGRAPIFGYPREMYVRGTRAYVIVSDYYTFWRDAELDFAPRAFYGSQLRIIDISDPQRPTVIGGIDLQGDCSDSRIVGNVMYLVSHRYPWYHRFETSDYEDKTQVLSVDISDPENVQVVDIRDFPRNGWEHHIHVTSQAIYLASSGYAGGDWRQPQTRIRYIDISDPAGRIAVRGETAATGRILDRWCLDEHEGVLRVASAQSWGNGDVYLTTYSVADPDQIRRLGGYTLRVDETLTSARFDGARGYLVSYRNIDPLFSFDLSNPARPRLLGELEMTGWLDFMVPMGDRIVALGHEDIIEPGGGRKISLAVSLIDVSEGKAPELLSRVTLDGAWGWVPGSRDDFAKVFKTLPDQGLIIFPFQAWSQTEYRYIGGVQLIDFDRSSLQKRGLIQNAGWVERGISHGPETVLTLSSEVFQVMDITDRDRPRLRGRLELARNVQEFALLPGDYAVQLSGDWYLGDLKLSVTDLLDPDTPAPLAQISVPAPYGRMFVNGSMVYVASVGEARDGIAGQGATKVQVVDLSDPLSPRLRGSVTLPEQVWLGYRGWFWGWGDEVVQVNGSTLAFHRFWYGWWGCLACDVAVAEDGDRAGGNPPERGHKIYLVDLADADAPQLASTVTLSDVDWAWGLKAAGTSLYLSVYRALQEEGQWVAKYYLRRIGVADPAMPVEHPPVNIPGIFIDASPGERHIYTMESWWDSKAQRSRTFLHALELAGEKAYLQSSVELNGWTNGIQVKDGAAFAVTQEWSVVAVDAVRPDSPQRWTSRVALVAVDLADPQALRIAGEATVPFDYAYLQKVEGGRAFIGSGAGIFSYQVSDITEPTFESFFRTQGWAQDIVVRDDHAFVPSGYYGVQVLELGAGN